MAPVPTTPAFVHEGTWDAQTDSHPATKWMRDYTNTFDTGDRVAMFDSLIAPNFCYSKADGQIFPEGKASWDAALETYQFFSKVLHIPYFLAIWEREDKSGWDLSGNAYLFADVVGPSDGKKSFTHDGQSYDVKIPSGFYFGYTKVGDSIKMDKMAITGDSGPVVVKLLQRGVMKPSDLGL